MSDPITGLNDRQEFFKVLHNNVIRANENGGKLALLIIQINRFQRINEVNGFEGGDAALHYVGQKLAEIKRDQDHIARISDTKFALILNKILNKGHAQLAAHKVIRVLEVPLDHNDKQIKISVSIGVSLCPSHSSVPMGLYKKSEEALKLAKLHEKPIGITPDDTGFEISDFWDIELGIEQALNESQFQLYYQPKLSLKTGKPVGAEALIRWPHPSRGMIRPDQFIPIAEQYNYIKPITIWILNVALRESSEWTEQWGPLSISANIPPELMDSELVDLVDNALNIWEPENVTLVLEILERSFAETGEDSFVVFEALQNLGAEISIDDFGTGYSALSYFKSIPAKELKVDQSFVLKLLDEKGNLDIVKLIINLAHAFDMRVVAEGVEDYKSLKTLEELGCDYIQGYYLAKPMPHKEFVQWLLDFKGIEVPETVVENSPEAMPKTIADAIPEVTTETIPEAIPETIPEAIPETIPETIPESRPLTVSDTPVASSIDATAEKMEKVAEPTEEQIAMATSPIEGLEEQEVYEGLAEIIEENHESPASIEPNPKPSVAVEANHSGTLPPLNDDDLPSKASLTEQLVNQTVQSNTSQINVKDQPGIPQQDSLAEMDASQMGLIDLDLLHTPNASRSAPKPFVELREPRTDPELDHELGIIRPEKPPIVSETTRSIYHDPSQDSLPPEKPDTNQSGVETAPPVTQPVEKKSTSQVRAPMEEEERKDSEMPGENDIDFGEPLI